MKQHKIAQYKKRETSRIIGEVEAMREDSEKLLSPKGAIKKLHISTGIKKGNRQGTLFILRSKYDSA
jgi:hypothetical protein